MCVEVCPHAVFEMGADKRAHIRDLDACMECGACSTNCAWNAIALKPGVGCAQAIIHSWVFGGEPSCDCGSGSQNDAGSSCC
jgi:NAD-dependent dihydropyrimidine dehydrogenase PreA subunit